MPILYTWLNAASSNIFIAFAFLSIYGYSVWFKLRIHHIQMYKNRSFILLHELRCKQNTVCT